MRHHHWNDGGVGCEVAECGVANVKSCRTSKTTRNTNLFSSPCLICIYFNLLFFLFCFLCFASCSIDVGRQAAVWKCAGNRRKEKIHLQKKKGKEKEKNWIRATSEEHEQTMFHKYLHLICKFQFKFVPCNQGEKNPGNAYGMKKQPNNRERGK